MKPWIAALALTLALPVASHAAERDPARGFKTLDTDGDGRISFAEYKTVSQKRIDRFIARHPDGKLAAATPEQRETMMKARFDAIDANHDGAIDAAEWAARPRTARQDQPRDNS
jgi:Ca2+-binding EF-hand superfamily protein